MEASNFGHADPCVLLRPNHSVRKWAYPTLTYYDYMDLSPATVSTIRIHKPELTSGRWYIGVFGFYDDGTGGGVRFTIAASLAVRCPNDCSGGCRAARKRGWGGWRG